jgi:hypothetical protein
MKKKKIISYTIMTLVAILIVGGVIYLYLTYVDPIKGIKFYERQTHQYYDSQNYSNAHYMIDSKEEFKVFKKRYDNPIKEKMNFDKDILFIQTIPTRSSSIKMKLKRVGIKDEKLVFRIKTKTPKIQTDDIAFWYFVAVIPKEKLKEIDLSDWQHPSKVKE